MPNSIQRVRSDRHHHDQLPQQKQHHDQLLQPSRQQRRLQHSGRKRSPNEPLSLSSSSPTFYPAYCYKASPTWFTWVKLTARDIHHHLAKRSEYQIARDNSEHNNFTGIGDVGGNASSVVERHGPRPPPHQQQQQRHLRHEPPPLLLFYLNHPIQFVQVVGVVVTYEEYLENIWLFAIDDGSGHVINVSCAKTAPKRSGLDTRISGLGSGVAHKNSSTVQGEIQPQTTGGPGLEVAVSDEEAATMERDGIISRLDIGSVVQVKGTIATYRDIRQIRLERIALVADTNREMELIAARTSFYQNTLSQPWTLRLSQVDRLRKEAEGDSERIVQRSKRHRKRERQKLDLERRHETDLLAQYQREGLLRQAAADEARQAGQLLKDQRQKSC